METSKDTITKAACSIRLNPEKGGVEIHFAQKPGIGTLVRIKERGFRWAKFNACWYHRANEESIRFACQIAEISPEATEEILRRHNGDAHQAGAAGMERALGIA